MHIELHELLQLHTCRQPRKSSIYHFVSLHLPATALSLASAGNLTGFALSGMQKFNVSDTLTAMAIMKKLQPVRSPYRIYRFCCLLLCFFISFSSALTTSAASLASSSSTCTCTFHVHVHVRVLLCSSTIYYVTQSVANHLHKSILSARTTP